VPVLWQGFPSIFLRATISSTFSRLPPNLCTSALMKSSSVAGSQRFSPPTSMNFIPHRELFVGIAGKPSGTVAGSSRSNMVTPFTIFIPALYWGAICTANSIVLISCFKAGLSRQEVRHGIRLSPIDLLFGFWKIHQCLRPYSISNLDFNPFSLSSTLYSSDTNRLQFVASIKFDRRQYQYPFLFRPDR
jgi:hypothetical protein